MTKLSRLSSVTALALCIAACGSRPPPGVTPPAADVRPASAPSAATPLPPSHPPAPDALVPQFAWDFLSGSDADHVWLRGGTIIDTREWRVRARYEVPGEGPDFRYDPARGRIIARLEYHGVAQLDPRSGLVVSRCEIHSGDQPYVVGFTWGSLGLTEVDPLFDDGCQPLTTDSRHWSVHVTGAYCSPDGRWWLRPRQPDVDLSGMRLLGVNAAQTLLLAITEQSPRLVLSRVAHDRLEPIATADATGVVNNAVLAEFSPSDARVLVRGVTGGTVQIFDVPGLRPLATFEDDSVHWLRTGSPERVFGRSRDGDDSVVVRDGTTGTEVARAPVDEGSSLFPLQGGGIAVTSSDGFEKWDDTLQRVAELPESRGGGKRTGGLPTELLAAVAAACPDRLALPAADVRRMPKAARDQRNVKCAGDHAVWSFGVGGNEPGRTGQVCIVQSISTGRVLWTSQAFEHIEPSADGSRLLGHARTPNQAWTVTVLDAATGRALGQVDVDGYPKVEFSLDTSRITVKTEAALRAYSVGSDGLVPIGKPARGTAYADPTAERYADPREDEQRFWVGTFSTGETRDLGQLPRTAAWSSDGQVMAAEGIDQRLHRPWLAVWNATTWEPVWRVAPPRDVYSLAFSRDGRFLLAEIPDGLALVRISDATVLTNLTVRGRSLSVDVWWNGRDWDGQDPGDLVLFRSGPDILTAPLVPLAEAKTLRHTAGLRDRFLRGEAVGQPLDAVERP